MHSNVKNLFVEVVAAAEVEAGVGYYHPENCEFRVENQDSLVIFGPGNVRNSHLVVAGVGGEGGEEAVADANTQGV